MVTINYILYIHHMALGHLFFSDTLISICITLLSLGREVLKHLYLHVIIKFLWQLVKKGY